MNKTVAILAGALIFVLVVQASQLISIAKANERNTQNGMGMHMGNHMSCMSMSLEEMDKNNDGICDMCGMPVSECKEMMEGNENMGEMMQEHHGMMGMNGMSCHM